MASSLNTFSLLKQASYSCSPSLNLDTLKSTSLEKIHFRTFFSGEQVVVSSNCRTRGGTWSLTSYRTAKENCQFGVSASLLNFVKMAFGEVAAPARGTAMLQPAPSRTSPLAPETITEFSVVMPCGGCAKTVRSALERVDGVKSIDIQLAHKVVRVVSSIPLSHLTRALDRTGKSYRMVARGSPAELALPHAVAELKGPRVFGVVRLHQLSAELAQVDAHFEGLPVGPTSWAIHAYGDLTAGAKSTGPIYVGGGQDKGLPVGDLGALEVDQSGTATYSSPARKICVSDLIGRSVVIHMAFTDGEPADVAAVIALSPGGKINPNMCGCDGTVLCQLKKVAA